MAIFFFKGLYWYPTKAMKMVYHTYKQEYEQLIIHHNITSWILEYFHIITNNNIIKSKHRPLFSFLQLASQFFISTFLLPLIHSNLPTRLFNLSISSFFFLASLNYNLANVSNCSIYLCGSWVSTISLVISSTYPM